jgi:WD40 repeat protein
MEGNARKLFGRRQMLDRLWFEGKPTTVKIEEIKSGVALLKFQRSKVFPDGTGVLAMGLTSGEVNLMKITSNDELKPWHVLKPREDPTYCINFDPSRMGNILVSSGSRSEVVVCNMDSGEVISHWNSNQKVVWNVSILDSSCIATCGEDSTIKLWDIHTQQLIHKFTHDLDHSQPIYDCATNDKTPSSNIIVSACQDRTVKVFDKRSGNCEALMKTSTCNFEVNLFGDSQVTCGGYSVISVFDLRKPEVLKASSIVFNDTTGSYPVRGLSVNGTRTVCGSRCEIDILSSHTDILRHYDRKSDPLHVINTMKCKDVLTLYSDDEYLMCGGLDGVTVSCFSKPIGKLNVSLDEKKEIKKKNCTIQ